MALLLGACCHAEQDEISRDKPQSCLSYEKQITLAGTISESTYAGPPNYESIAGGDAAEKDLFLTLDNPVCLRKNPSSVNNAAVIRITKFQLAGGKGKLKSLFSLSGKRVEVTGKIFGMFNGHHHTPALIMVTDVASLKKENAKW
jgi:hypothetical protein